MRNVYDINSPLGYNCPKVQCQECNCNVDCVCPACENTVVQDTDLLCAHMTENINQNQNTICEYNLFVSFNLKLIILGMKITQNSLYMGLGIALIYILGILSVIIFLAVRKRCRNRKAQAWFRSKVQFFRFSEFDVLNHLKEFE